MTISFSFVVLAIIVLFIFRKSISRVTEVAPEVTSITIENVRRAAVSMDEHVALACLQSHVEATEQAEELAQDLGANFNGDIIALYESQVKSHDYSRRARRQAVANKNQQ